MVISVLDFAQFKALNPSIPRRTTLLYAPSPATPTAEAPPAVAAFVPNDGSVSIVWAFGFLGNPPTAAEFLAAYPDAIRVGNIAQ